MDRTHHRPRNKKTTMAPPTPNPNVQRLPKKTIVVCHLCATISCHFISPLKWSVSLLVALHPRLLPPRPRPRPRPPRRRRRRIPPTTRITFWLYSRPVTFGNVN